MSAIQPWNQPEHFDRSTRRGSVERRRRATLAGIDERDQRVAVAKRIQGGALLSGELNHWGGLLAVQAQQIAAHDPAAGARANYVLDRLAAGGAALISDYLGEIK